VGVYETESSIVLGKVYNEISVDIQPEIGQVPPSDLMDSKRKKKSQLDFHSPLFKD
jgi:hypothetical protein